MAFFDLPADEELTPEVRQMLEESRRLLGTEQVPRTFKMFGRNPKIVEARLKAFQHLGFPSKFPWEARNLAIMLIAHAKRCEGCFESSRLNLEKLGFDRTTLDGICANPESLALKERDRLFVRHALKIATDSANLQPKDLREMAAQGFSKEDIREIIAFAAFWTMMMVFTQSGMAGLAEE